MCLLLGVSGNAGDQIRLLNNLGYELEWQKNRALAVDAPVLILFAACILQGEAFQVWQRLYFPEYHALPIISRTLIGRLIATGPVTFGGAEREGWFPDMEIFKHFIDTKWDETSAANLITQSVDCGYSLLGSVAYALGWASAWARDEPRLVSQPRKIDLRNWDLLAREIIFRHPILLHPIEAYQTWARWGVYGLGILSDSKLTPLWAVCIAAFLAGYRKMSPDNDQMHGTRPRPKFLDNVNFALRLWLNALCSCGIDLMEYGRVERNLVSNDKITRDLEINLARISGPSDGLVGWMRIISIDISPRPEDWRIRWVFEYEIYAREFWEMVEETALELAIPGSWVD